MAKLSARRLTPCFLLKQDREVAATAGASGVSDGLCKICMDAPRDTLSLPCRHAAMCRFCAEAVKRRSGLCPICKVRIQRLETVRGAVQTFMGGAWQ